jgi:hypothetical protein
MDGILDNDWVPQTGQGFIYNISLDPEKWTELKQILGPEFWTGNPCCD